MNNSGEAKVYFFSLDARPGIRNTGYLKKFIESIFRKENHRLNTISYIFCSDKKILEINKKYLSHYFYTDVITFDLSTDKKSISAEVYISVDRVRDNARNLGVTIKSELHRVVFHAVLHLCGYDDKKKSKMGKMRRKEDELLSSFFKK